MEGKACVIYALFVRPRASSGRNMGPSPIGTRVRRHAVLFVHDRERVREEVPNAVARALHGLFCEGQPTPAPGATATAAAWLLELRRHEHWLACRCGDTVADEALLSPRQIEADRVVLVRHGKHPHALTCPFHRLRSLASLSGGGVSHHSATPLLDELIVDAENPDGTRDRYRGALMRLLTTAGFHRVGPSEFLIRGRDDLARASAVDVPAHYRLMDRIDDCLVSADRTFAEVGCHHVTGLTWLGRRLREAGHDGIILAVIRDVDAVKRVITVKSNDGGTTDIQIRDRLWVHTGGGPYWLLGRVSATDRGCDIVAAYAHPLLAPSLLMPVDGDFEREMAHLLLGQVRYWMDVRRVAVALEKPCVVGDDGRRPDFALHLDENKRLSVEVYPYNDSDYESLRMRDTEGTPSGAHQLVRLVRGRGDAMSWRKRLTAAVLAESANSSVEGSSSRVRDDRP